MLINGERAIDDHNIISAYPSLPQTYPIHFTLSGVPNGWENKSWSTTLQFPLIQLGVFLLMAVMTSWLAFSS